MKKIVYDFLESFMPKDAAIFVYALIFGEYPKIEIPESGKFRSKLEWKDIPSYGSHVTMNVFREWCTEGSVIDNDGIGYYATADKMSNQSVYPSDVAKGLYDKGFTHVVWFNK